jgi:polyhydroxyalkanoate synthesis regulator phasin
MDMRKWLKKSAIMGLGIVSLTKKHAENLAKDLEKQGTISSKEGRKLANELMKESKKQSANLQRLIKSEVEKTLSAAGVATKKDLHKLKKELKGKKRRK